MPEDAAATAANIVADETMFRLALGADILMAVVFVLLGLTLFRLLHRDHGRWATALLIFVSVGAGGILVNLVFQVGALLAATDPITRRRSGRTAPTRSRSCCWTCTVTGTCSVGCSSGCGCCRWAW